VTLSERLLPNAALKFKGGIVWRVTYTLLTLAVATMLPTEARSAVCLVAESKSISTKLWETKDGTLWAMPDFTFTIPSLEPGLFRETGGKLIAIPADHVTGFVDQLLETKDGTLWAATWEGLFREAGGKLIAIPADHVTGHIEQLLEAKDGTLWAATENGLFREASGKLIAIPADHVTGFVNQLLEAKDGTLWAATKHGLFRETGGKLIAIPADYDIGIVNQMLEAKDGSLWVATENGLFREAGGKLIAIPADHDMGVVHQLLEAKDDSLWAATENGLFREAGGKLIAIPADHDTGVVEQLLEAKDGTFWAATWEGLFREAGGKLIAIPADHVTGVVYQLLEAKDDSLWAATENGLFREAGGKLIAITADHVTGVVHQLLEAKDGSLWAATQNGLFRLINRSWAAAQTTVPSSANVYLGTPTAFTWTVSHPCSFSLGQDDLELRGVPDIPKNWIQDIEIIPGTMNETTTIRATIAFANRSESPYKVQLLLKEKQGNTVEVGKAVLVTAGWDFADYFKHYGEWLAGLILAAEITVFIALIVGAHWSAFCWRVLMDPVWNKVVWAYWILRNAGPLQRWAMARWFLAVRKSTGREPYLPMSLSDEDGQNLSSADLPERIKEWPRLWIQGNPGMGKTALVDYVRSLFFADPILPTLQKAYTRFGGIPIIVPLREYRHVAFDPSKPEDWVASAARTAVSAFGMPFEDEGLFRAMIKSGGFLLVLDGANEVERDSEIDLFAKSAPNVRMLVTSQSPGSRFFANWHLPHTISDEIEPLLNLLLGEDLGKRIFVRVKATPLLSAIRSGYDVRLIADLIETHGEAAVLPADRLGLYQLILAAIQMPNGSQYPEDRLCKAAWTMWCNGERKLETGKLLDQDLLEPLINEDKKVLRILDGQQFEFRHDQMRAYLAARWAAEHEAWPIGLFEKESEIWRLSRKEQDEVWGFFADMITVERLPAAIALWKWSTTNPDRVILQHALQRALKQAGLDPEISEIEPQGP